ncbi:MAG: type IV toxin-antitoxin system AbiEi family antitoxin domain-containing protein [Acidimicrobiales bacterium]
MSADFRELVELAAGQDGLLTTAQLRALGVDRSAQSRMCTRGLLDPVHRGVVRVAGAPITWRQRVRAACLADDRLAASHRSALRLWDMRTVDDEVEVTIRYPASRVLDGVGVHRSVDLDPRDVTHLEEIPVTSPARTLADAGLVFPAHEVRRLVDHSVAVGKVTKSELIDVRRRFSQHGRNGLVSLDLAIDALPAGAAETDSGPEVALLRLLADAGLPEPVRQHRVMIGGAPRFIDLAYPQVRLALEYDGNDPHTRVDRFESDRRRQNGLVLLGWTVLRYTHGDLRDRPHHVVRQIRSLLDL